MITLCGLMLWFDIVLEINVKQTSKSHETKPPRYKQPSNSYETEVPYWRKHLVKEVVHKCIYATLCMNGRIGCGSPEVIRLVRSSVLLLWLQCLQPLSSKQPIGHAVIKGAYESHDVSLFPERSITLLGCCKTGLCSFWTITNSVTSEKHFLKEVMWRQGGGQWIIPVQILHLT